MSSNEAQAILNAMKEIQLQEHKQTMHNAVTINSQPKVKDISPDEQQAFRDDFLNVEDVQLSDYQQYQTDAYKQFMSNSEKGEQGLSIEQMAAIAAMDKPADTRQELSYSDSPSTSFWADTTNTAEAKQHHVDNAAFVDDLHSKGYTTEDLANPAVYAKVFGFK